VGPNNPASTRAQDDIAVTTDFTFTDDHTLNQDGK
jgi:hypothetical protein